MGYTHYFYRSPTLPAEAFKLFVEDVRKMLANLPAQYASAGRGHNDKPIVICGPDGTGSPEISEEVIAFNGTKEGDLCHEPFVVEQVFEPQSWERPEEDGKYFTCCKTAFKPYDLLVVGCLYAAIHRFGKDVRVGSDGDDRDRSEGYEFYIRVCQPENPPKLSLHNEEEVEA